MAVKAIDDSARPYGLLPTLSLFVALFRLGLPTDASVQSNLKQAAALRKATSAMSKHFPSRQARNAPRARYLLEVSSVHKTIARSEMLVHRPVKDM